MRYLYFLLMLFMAYFFQPNQENEVVLAISVVGTFIVCGFLYVIIILELIL